MSDRQALNKLSTEELYSTRKLINEILQQRRRKVYIIEDYDQSYIDLPNFIYEFIYKYRNDNKKVYNYFCLCNDPTWVLMAILFEKHLGYFRLRTYELLPHEYITYNYSKLSECWRYLIVTNNEDEIVNYDFKYMSDPPQCQNRPDKLFEALKKFGEELGWTMDISSALSQLPTNGPYRLYD